MRLKAMVRCSASLGVLGLVGMWAAPAWAQPGGSQQSQPQTAQETPADNTEVEQEADAQDQLSSDPATQEGEIIVTGIRESLRSTRNVRRNSEQIVDAIIAEDIGKLPDIAVSDTAARIPGVQVIRAGGEASRVLVRGLPDFATTYNGREIFTAETRLVALQDFPSANIASLEVFKTTTANLVEAGLAGLVNVRSRRPFDFNEGQIAGSVWGLYTYQADQLTPNANILLTDRWETGMGDIGILVNASYTQLKFLDSEPSNTDFIADPFFNGSRIRYPDIQRLFYREGNRTRPSVNVALQWRPSDNFELYAEGLYQGFRNEVSDRRLDVPLYTGAPGDRPYPRTLSNIVLRPGTNQVSSGTITGLTDPIFTFQGGTFNETDTFQYAVGGIYEAGPLRVSFDVAHTDSTFTGSTESVDRIVANPQNITVNFDLERPQFTVLNVDLNNPANFLFDGLYEEQQESSGEDWQYRGGAVYEFEDFFIRSVQAGLRYSDRIAHREFGNRFAGFRGRNIPATSLPLDFQVFDGGFRGTDFSGTRSYTTPTYESIRDNRRALREFVLARAPFGGFGTFTVDPPAPNPNDTYDATEETLAGYGQVNFQFGEDFDGTIGLRVVSTDTRVTGTSVIQGVATPINVGPSFTDYLPNASIRWRITPELQLRLSATQTRTRPTFAELNPSFNLGAPDPLLGGRRVGSGGNPNLQPFESDNFDAALEYYFSRTGFASVSVFRRNLSGFIQNRTEDITDPLLGPIRITRPTNTGEGQIEGVEGQIQTFFDFGGLPEWLAPFGFQANFTYLDATTGFPTGAGPATVQQQILGVSDFTYNLVGLYEAGGLSARLTYNDRSPFIDFRANRGDDLYFEEADQPGRLDFSLNYDLFENATIFFDWTNILQEPFRQDLSSARAGAERAEYIRFLRYEETTVSLGLRFRL